MPNVASRIVMAEVVGLIVKGAPASVIKADRYLIQVTA